MSEQHSGLPVSGYRPQGQTAVDTVNINKALEELCLRRLDKLQAETSENQKRIIEGEESHSFRDLGLPHDPRMLALARTKLQEAFMWMNRATFQPARVDGTEDELLSKVTNALATDDPSVGDHTEMAGFLERVIDYLRGELGVFRVTIANKIWIGKHPKLPAYTIKLEGVENRWPAVEVTAAIAGGALPAGIGIMERINEARSLA